METSSSTHRSTVATLRTPSAAEGFRPAARDQGRRILRGRQHLIHAGEPVDQPWLVVAGVLKSYLLHADGEEQVLDFHLPGDIIGLDAMINGQATSSVLALDTCSVQPLDLQPPRADRRVDPTQTHRVIQAMHQEILRLTRRLHMAVESTDQRLAAYLLGFSEHQHRRGFSASELRLPMRRRDLALYLGLATETLSRAFTRLRKRGLLAVDNYDVRILDPDGLRKLAGCAAQLTWQPTDNPASDRSDATQ